MFARFNKNTFPIVFVTMCGVIENNAVFDTFTRNWLSCYIHDKPFSFIFDMTNVGLVSIYYAYRMSSFIEELRKLKFTSLKKSIIIANTSYLRVLLKMIFLLQTPVAPVFIVETKDSAIELYNDIENGIIKSVDFPNIPNITYISTL